MTPRRGAILAALAALGVYAGSLGGGFIYDDVPLILENPLVRSGTASQLLASPYWRRPGGGEGGLYRPLAVAAHRANAALTGFSAPAFRCVNALLHAGVSALAVFLAAGLGLSAAAATLAGLAFAVMPVHAEAVAWAVGRAELLAAGFALAAWLCLLGTLRPARLAGGALLFLAALLSKESAAALPAAVVAADLARREPAKLRAPAWLMLAGTLALYLFWRAQVLGAAFNVGRPYFGALGWPEVPLTMARYFWRAWVIAPVTGLGLCADWARPAFPDSSAGDPLGWAALVAASAAAVWAGRSRSLGGLVFLTLAAPMSNLLVPMEILGAERTMYLPTFGLCLLVAALWERFPTGRARNGVAAAALLWWGGLTAARARVWGSEQSLWETTATCAPGNPRALTGLAMVRAGQNRREEARELLRRAFAADPDSGAAAFNLALLNFEDGRPGPADAILVAFEASHRPGDARFAALRGRIAEEGGRPGDAVVEYRRAVALDPLYALAHRNLGLLYARAGQTAASRTELEAALRLDPSDVEVRAFLAAAP